MYSEFLEKLAESYTNATVKEAGAGETLLQMMRNMGSVGRSLGSITKNTAQTVGRDLNTAVSKGGKALSGFTNPSGHASKLAKDLQQKLDVATLHGVTNANKGVAENHAKLLDLINNVAGVNKGVAENYAQLLGLGKNVAGVNTGVLSNAKALANIQKHGLESILQSTQSNREALKALQAHSLGNKLDTALQMAQDYAHTYPAGAAAAATGAVSLALANALKKAKTNAEMKKVLQLAAAKR